MKKLLLKMKDKFNENKNRNMLILVILILTILSSITLITYSFYQNRSSNLIIAGVASIDKSDVKIKVYREDKNSSGVGLGTYSLSYYVPNETSYSYNSSKTSCDTGITINKYENRIFYVNATKKGTCKVYFDAIDGYIDDYEVNLFVQQEIGSTDDKNYEQMGQLPLYETGYYYTVNSSKTSCNPSATVSIVGRKITVLTSEQTVCNVYVDKNVDSSDPVINSIDTSSKKIAINLSDNAGLSEWAVTIEEKEPTEWENVSGTSATVNYDINSNGTYYLYVKDISGRVIYKSFTMGCAETMVANFDYTGSVQKYVTTCKGTYTLHVWGAQGGTASTTYIGGYGGYSTGNVNLNNNVTLYVYVGNQPSSVTGGYNGGGTVSTNGHGGGGATHIATTEGLLSTLQNKLDNLLIVAGGGGGSVDYGSSAPSGSGGHAGGYIGSNGYYGTWSTNPGKGGTQSSGGSYGLCSDNNVCGLVGSFGQGGNLYSCSETNCNTEYQTGGGGGFYGGGSARHTGGGGGSGYIANSLLTNKVMYCFGCAESSTESTKTIKTSSYSQTATVNYAKLGNGYARIIYNP